MASFGKIALGVRIVHAANAAFFTCWTQALLSGGVRPGDRVLAPAYGLPHHMAAQALVHQFLNTEADSLLFIDDDMTFTVKDIETLRDDAEHLPYDIISGCCIMRGEPFHPVIKTRVKSEDGKGMWTNPVKVPLDTVIPVDGIGLAFTLIRRHVFELVKDALRPGEMLFQWSAFGDSEDIFFSDMAKKLGYKLGVTTKVLPGHMVEMEASYLGDGQIDIRGKVKKLSYKTVLETLNER